jgi:hypothetical protein
MKIQGTTLPGTGLGPYVHLGTLFIKDRARVHDDGTTVGHGLHLPQEG